MVVIMQIAVINYGMGNLSSIFNALKAVGASPIVVFEAEKLEDVDGIVLPGVGAFSEGMKHLKERGWIERLEVEVIERKKPFLGICLGMQLLATYSMEYGRHDGLNWIPGSVELLKKRSLEIRLPHVGWNDVSLKQGSVLYNGIGDFECFYFVHSFAFQPEESSVVTGTCEYGDEFVASIEKGNIMATQFHPEKSHHAGLAVMRNFIEAVYSC